ncbi:hypothetical protein EV715DRAFT_201859 [Schizophyllum commune]
MIATTTTTSIDNEQPRNTYEQERHSQMVFKKCSALTNTDEHSCLKTTGATSRRAAPFALRTPTASVPHIARITLLTTMFSLLWEPVLAQAPVNDVVSWPSGLLLLASALYAALGTNCENLWSIDPSIGPFLWKGLPTFSIPAMRRVNWVSAACHFVPGIRTAIGVSNFWIRSEEVSAATRAEALRKAAAVLHPVVAAPPQTAIDDSLCALTSAGLVVPASLAPIPPPSKADRQSFPTARDFLLFAATDYHAFRSWEVRVFRGDRLIFSTKGMPHSSAVDVDDEEMALGVVAAQMVRRPLGQSTLRQRAKHLTDDDAGPYELDLNQVNTDAPICAVDFHSYAPPEAKVSESLNELAGAYFRVVQYLKLQAETSGNLPGLDGRIAEISVGQTMWLAILGGALLDSGRLTIQNLPGRWGMQDISADEAYITRIEAVLQALEPYANTPSFFDLVFSGGTSRRWTHPFLIAGICGQMIICYFLAVGTSAGVWTSVALANSLYSGRLTDWHSRFYGKTSSTSEPGTKMYVPCSPTKDIMCIATLDRSTPRIGGLRPGILLNSCGLVAAIFGAVFQQQTRDALDFGAPSPTAPWVVYTSIVLAVVTSLLILVSIILQHIHEGEWRKDCQLPTRWAVYATLFGSFSAAGLAAFFVRCRWARLWPVLDVITWLTGLPLGVLENGHMFAIDDNLLHLILLNRWIIGAVASSVGSSDADGAGVC